MRYTPENHPFLFGAMVFCSAFFLLRCAEPKFEQVWHEAVRGDMEWVVEATGTLASTNSVHIGCPRVPRMWRYTISYLAPEGSAVKKGTLLLRFEDRKLRDDLAVTKTRLESALKDLEKTKLDQEEALERLELELAEQESKAVKAKRRAEVPSHLESGSQLQLFKYDLELALAKQDLFRARLQKQRLKKENSIVFGQRKINRLEARVKLLNESITKLTVLASQKGLVVYKSQNNEKPVVGDNVWVGRDIMEIPDLSKMCVAAVIAERDAGKVAVDQCVEIRLDANPEKAYYGRVEKLGTVFRTKSRQKPSIVFDARITIDDPDPKIMRPGMAAKLSIKISRQKDVLQIPLKTLQFDQQGAFVTLNSGVGTIRKEVKVGLRNEGMVVILEGLEPGEMVLDTTGGEDL